MKAPALLASLIVSSLALGADETADLRAPKAESPRLLRVLLHLPGSPRLLDYSDVERVISCDASRVTFETADGQIVFHQGSFTIIQPRGGQSKTSDGSRFYDAR